MKNDYKFIQYKSGNLYKYYDSDNVVSLSIFNSGWDNKYQCVKEWGEYEMSESNIYTPEEINIIYGINIFLRKEKLLKINESIL